MSARTDLSGGYQATGIPTGIHLQRARPTSIPASPGPPIALPRQLYEPQPHKLVTHRFAMNDMLKPDAVLRQATMRADRAELCAAQA